MSGKTRNQSLYDYLESLQFEYIQAELRKKIYTRTKDRLFQEKVMSRKQVKIMNISERNSLKNLFTDASERERFEALLYNKDSYPNFLYATQEQSEEYRVRDFENYYSIGADVRVLENGETLIATITKSPDEGMILVQVRGEDEPRLVKGETVVRIL